MHFVIVNFLKGKKPPTSFIQFAVNLVSHLTLEVDQGLVVSESLLVTQLQASVDLTGPSALEQKFIFK